MSAQSKSAAVSSDHAEARGNNIGSDSLTHVDSAGKVRMVDVGAKPVTPRAAVAVGTVLCAPETVALLRTGELAKGDALAVARIAGIAAAKKTPDLIPLCHPIAITGVDVRVELVEAGVQITAQVRTAERTGIEMEALTSVTVAALNIIDMVKAVDRAAHIGEVRVDRKEGGASGTWVRGERTADREQANAEEPREAPAQGARGHTHGDAASSSAQYPAEPAQPVLTGRTGVVTVSDRASKQMRPDETGPMIAETLTRWGTTPTHVTVPDDAAQIANAVQELVRSGAWLIITTGGTGITARDVSPDAVGPLFDKEMPALAAAIAASGIGKAPGALLSRPAAGVIGSSAVVTLPGSKGGVRDGLNVLEPVVAHLAEQLNNGDH